MNSSIHKWISLWVGIVFCVAFLLPNHYSPWLSVHQELAAAVAFAPLLAFFAVKRAPLPPLAVGAMVLSLVPLVQWMYGKVVFGTDASMAFLYLTGFALAVHAGSVWVNQPMKGLVQSARSSTGLIPLWMALLVAAIISVGLATHQWLIPDHEGIYVVEIPPRARPFANLAQPNQLATLLLLGSCGLMFLWEMRQLRTYWVFVVACWLIFGLMMTGSRSVFLALLWFVPAYFLMRRKCRLRMTPLALAFFIGLYFFFLWAWPIASQALLLPVPDGTAIDRLGTTSARIQIWIQLMGAVWQKPWLGWGWGQVSMAQIYTAIEYPAIYASFESGHNLFLDLAVWAGLPVAVFCLGGLSWWGVKRIRRVNEPLRWICLIAVGFVFSHAMVEYPLYYAYFMFPVAVLMGALTDVSQIPPRRVLLNRDWRVLTLVAAALSGVLLIRVAWEYFPFEADWQLLRFQEARIGDLEPTEPPPALVLTSLHDFLQWSRVKPVPGMLETDIEHIRQISERFSYAAPMYRLAFAQALNGHTIAAQETLTRLCRMHTLKVCASARKDWMEKSAGDFPQLLAVDFPASRD